MAVAAAALLCIGSAFAVRGCGARHGEERDVVVIDHESQVETRGSGDGDTSASSDETRSDEKKNKEKRRGKNVSKRAKKGEKTYPTRSPLDEPI